MEILIFSAIAALTTIAIAFCYEISIKEEDPTNA